MCIRDRNKGPGKPYFSSEIRKKVLNNLEIVDYVSEIEDESALKGILKLKPNFLIKKNLIIGIEMRLIQIHLIKK